MELDFAILARRVETKKGMSHTEALGWKLYSMAEFPQPLDAALLFRIDLEDWEASLPHSVEIFFLDEYDNAIAKPIGIEACVKVGQRHFTHDISLTHLIIQREGSYKVAIAIDHKLAKTIPFRIKLRKQVAALAPTPA